jgi:hypothetical protein
LRWFEFLATAKGFDFNGLEGFFAAVGEVRSTVLDVAAVVNRPSVACALPQNRRRN